MWLPLALALAIPAGLLAYLILTRPDGYEGKHHPQKPDEHEDDTRRRWYGRAGRDPLRSRDTYGNSIEEDR